MFLRNLLAAIALVTLFSAAPVFAQGFDPQEMQQMERAQAAPSQPNLPNIGRPYAIRVTTGAHTSAGWERGLTRGDPNLRHWCWMPVTTYDQGYIRVPAAADASNRAPQRPTHCYVKPEKMPLPLNPAYSKPFKPVYPNYGVAEVSSARTRVAAKLAAHLPLAHRAEPVETKKYASSYSDIAGRLLPRRESTSSSARVSGKLLSTSR